MNKALNLFAIVSACIFSCLVFISYASKDEGGAMSIMRNLPQMVYSPDVSGQFDWAGELVPMTADARERLDRELLLNSYYHNSTTQALKLANRYFPQIESILREHGVPDDFKYLAVAESGLRNVSSPASAKGFWQFRKLAAKEYGLEVNDEVDERYHVEKATRAACKYILWLKSKFGTWTDASAAYNVGPTSYKKQMALQKEDNYYAMNLNQETSRYIFRLVAIKEIMSNPEQFGFYINPEDKYPPLDDYYNVEVDASVKNWGDFAHDHGTTYRELKRYNPWLRDNHLTVIKNKYQVKIPQG